MRVQLPGFLPPLIISICREWGDAHPRHGGQVVICHLPRTHGPYGRGMVAEVEERASCFRYPCYAPASTKEEWRCCCPSLTVLSTTFLPAISRPRSLMLPPLHCTLSTHSRLERMSGTQFFPAGQTASWCVNRCIRRSVSCHVLGRVGQVNTLSTACQSPSPTLAIQW